MFPVFPLLVPFSSNDLSGYFDLFLPPSFHLYFLELFRSMLFYDGSCFHFCLIFFVALVELVLFHWWIFMEGSYNKVFWGRQKNKYLTDIKYEIF